MGIDYTPISGFGIKVTEEEIRKNFTLAEFDDNGHKMAVIEAFEKTAHFTLASLCMYGSSLSGNIEYALLMNNALADGIMLVSEKLFDFRKFLDDNGFRDKKIEEISEIHQW